MCIYCAFRFRAVQKCANSIYLWKISFFCDMEVAIIYNMVLGTLFIAEEMTMDMIRRNRMIEFLFVVLLMALLALIILFIVYARKNNRWELERNYASRTDCATADMKEAKRSHAEAYSRLRATDVCRYFVEQCQNEEAAAVSSEKWDELSAEVNLHFPGFTQQLTEMHKLSEYELRVCLLLKIKATPLQIARLTMHSPEAVSSSSRRMYEKVFGEKGSPKQWDEFIEMI